jgi:rhamnulokinase
VSRFIAFDVGAESGRAIVGILEDDQLRLEEAHRFTNGAVVVGPHLHWDVLRIFSEVIEGLRSIRRKYGTEFASLGIDTWGVDFALLDREGNLVGNPHSYRDARTRGMMEEVLARVPREDIFAQTGGIQFLSINTLYQLYAMVKARSPALEIARRFCMMPDLFNAWLTGTVSSEFTNATSTQMYDSRQGTWAWRLLAELGIPAHLFPEAVLPGTVIGPLSKSLAAELDFPSLAVVAPATHDTASAAVAVPARDRTCAWLSSGTWSLLGAYSPRPITTPEALAYNFSSYGGAGGTFLPWKNIMGLWLIQECRRRWANEGKTWPYEELCDAAAAAPPFVALLRPDHPSFLAPADMPAAIRAYCVNTRQRVPETEGSLARTIFEGLALAYRWTLEKLEKILDRQFTALHVVGGGSRNKLLCQFTADAIGLPVVAGPVEATAIGNIVVQAVAMGALSSIDDAPAIVRRSFDVVTYEPVSREPWDRAYERFSRDHAAEGW